MVKKILYIIFFSFVISGCSKENKNSPADIKIEQQNPPQKESTKETPNEQSKEKPDEKLNSETTAGEQVQQKQNQKSETVSLKSKQAAKYIGKNAVVTGYIADV